MTAKVAILARFPVAGHCKTRLIPGFGPEGAAEIHRKLTERTVRTVRASGVPFVLHGTGAEEAAFQEWLGPVTYRAQPAGDLGKKLLAAGPPYPTIFLGTDCPALEASHLEEAADLLDNGHPAVIGPAEDGGYWMLGLGEERSALFRDMPWGTDKVFELTMERLREREIEPRQLPTLSDIDHPEDLDPWPELKP